MSNGYSHHHQYYQYHHQHQQHHYHGQQHQQHHHHQHQQQQQHKGKTKAAMIWKKGWKKLQALGSGGGSANSSLKNGKSAVSHAAFDAFG